MFDIANLSLGVVILLLRVAVVFLLYFFLWQVLRVVTRDLGLGGQPAAAANANPYGQLVVTSSGMPGVPVGKVFPLTPVTIMGRSPDTDIALNDTFLSGEHARLELRSGTWMLEDMNSTNGTYLNGFEVRTATEVHDGDIIRVGRIELRIMAR